MVELAVFCEDRGHEVFTRALVSRLARELDVEVAIKAVSAARGVTDVVDVKDHLFVKPDAH